jgi:hypothetical protein
MRPYLPWIIFTAGPGLLAYYGVMLRRVIKQPTTEGE